MLDKKVIEKQHYDAKVLDQFHDTQVDYGLTSLADQALIAAHRYFDRVVKETIAHRQKGDILDYGCGTGVKTISYASDRWRLTGIDISPESVKFARKLAQQRGITADYMIMDCENMQFPDNRFDVIIDYGTFSSLDINKAMFEIIRVLKKNGTLIAIETLGHNPLYNLRRKINVLTKRRTAWAAGHIMKLSDWAHMTSYFRQSEIKHFALLTPCTVPLLKLVPGRYREHITNCCAKIDDRLLNYKSFQKMAFKTVAVMADPAK
jgi:ubiquinone/menaquinone biosynthesis C-methylase UbiE